MRAVPAQEMTPEQAAMRVLQQQRNQAAAQASDQQATMAYIQAEAAAKEKYWEAYVKGLTPKPPEPAPKK
jgi:hypothetical protein